MSASSSSILPRQIIDLQSECKEVFMVMQLISKYALLHEEKVVQACSLEQKGSQIFTIMLKLLRQFVGGRISTRWSNSVIGFNFWIHSTPCYSKRHHYKRFSWSFPFPCHHQCFVNQSWCARLGKCPDLFNSDDRRTGGISKPHLFAI